MPTTQYRIRWKTFKLQEQRINPDLTFLGNFAKKSPCHLKNTRSNPCVMFLGLRISSFSFGHLPTVRLSEF